ncbi:MAG TPA: electron transport complex subunit RsxC [Candidatus Macondimonas sp.]|nr:electron transport complex subunit RsxC [Candidatus Macondimonas sp.]
MVRVESARYGLRGGLALQPARPEPALPCEEAPLSPLLILPLQSRAGEAALPQVPVGERVLRGQCIARLPGRWDAALHAGSSGEVIAIEPRPVAVHAEILTVPCIVIRTDGADKALPRLPPCDPVLMDRMAVLQRLAEAGVVGLGGAVFSTAAKLACAVAAEVDTLILNAAECEPHIRCDEALLVHQADRIAQGARTLADFLGKPQVLIGLKETLDAAPLVAALTAVGLDEARIVRVPAHYTAGAEDILIRLLTGREVPRGGLPTDIGCVCLNVATVVAAGDALLRGEPLTSRIVTMSGPGLARAANLVVRLGTPMADLIAACGGYTGQASQLILGGPMMGLALPDDALPVTKASQALWVAAAAQLQAPRPVLPCIRCGACAEVCPVRLLPQQLHAYAHNGDAAELEAHALDVCIECGCCDVVCPSQIPLVQTFRDAKTELAHAQGQDHRAAWLKGRFEARAARLEQLKTLRENRHQSARDQLRREDPRERLARLKARRHTGGIPPKKGAP